MQQVIQFVFSAEWGKYLSCRGHEQAEEQDSESRYEPEKILFEQIVSFWRPEYIGTESKLYETATKKGLFIKPLTHNLMKFRNMYAIKDYRIPVNETVITDMGGLVSFVMGGFDCYMQYCEKTGVLLF